MNKAIARVKLPPFNRHENLDVVKVNGKQGVL